MFSFTAAEGIYLLTATWDGAKDTVKVQVYANSTSEVELSLEEV